MLVRAGAKIKVSLKARDAMPDGGKLTIETANSSIDKGLVFVVEDEPLVRMFAVDLTYSYAYVGIKRLGTGQFYLISIKDKDGKAFSGANEYRLDIPANVPIEQYWSLTAYDRETHALIRNVPRASVFPQCQLKE